MTIKKEKVICTVRHCGWKGYSDEILQGVNPFDPNDIVNGCPNCKCIDTLVIACDEEGCWREATCGTPTENGYRNTCGEHRPK